MMVLVQIRHVAKAIVSGQMLWGGQRDGAAAEQRNEEDAAAVAASASASAAVGGHDVWNSLNYAQNVQSEHSHNETLHLCACVERELRVFVRLL